VPMAVTASLCVVTLLILAARPARSAPSTAPGPAG
jgi:hypothetical protein